MHAATLGDSKYAILSISRNDDNQSWKATFTGPSLQHHFNAPFQLYIKPKTMNVNDNNVYGDSVETALVQKSTVSPKDIILLATDGLWDNLYLEPFLNYPSITKLAEQYIRFDHNMSSDAVQDQLDEFVEALINEAQNMMSHRTVISPFVTEASKQNITGFMGGKEDDISIVAGCIFPITDKVN